MKMVRVYWTDAHNASGAWHTQEEAMEFVKDNNFQCSNVGFLVHVDKDCVLIASRTTNSGDQVGLIERIPRRMIERVTEVLDVERLGFDEESVEEALYRINELTQETE